MNDIPECLLWEVLVGVFSPKFVLHRMFKDTEAILSISHHYLDSQTNEFSQHYGTKQKYSIPFTFRNFYAKRYNLVCLDTHLYHSLCGIRFFKVIRCVFH